MQLKGAMIMLSRNDVLNAKEIYFSKHREILIPVENHNWGYVFTAQSARWEVTKRWYDWKSKCKALTPREALKIIDSRIKRKRKSNERLNDAIEFATKRHRGQYRKGTTIPYIVHPLEVMQILLEMGADTKLAIAGVLHDTVEDTNTTLEEIKERFGADVAKLVNSNSEDKSKSWEERKQHTIDSLAKASHRVKMLVMADKLANLRSIARDYEAIGDRLWSRFNAPKKKQAWYYDKIDDALYDMQFITKCQKAYWEYTGLFKDVFVKYYIDNENSVIYQSCDAGNVYYLKKGNPQWIDAFNELCKKISEDIISSEEDKKIYFNINPIPDNAVLISRKEAEHTEDIWNEPFWDCHAQDMQDNEYHVYDSEKRCFDIKIINSGIILLCCDYGEQCLAMNGKTEYEFSYSLNDEATHRFLAQLRIKRGIEKTLENILIEEFGFDNGPAAFKEFCNRIGVQTEFFSR